MGTFTLTPGTMILVWLGLLIILVLIELLTVGLTTIWFAGGSLAAIIANLCGVGIIGQIVIFLVVSCILLIFTRPWALKYLNQNHTRTNYEGVIGKVIRITQRVDNLSQTGKSIVDGQEWTVRAKEDDEVLEKGELAKVVNISGVKLIVIKYEEE